MFLKNRNFISKTKRSKVTDYAALKGSVADGKRILNKEHHIIVCFLNLNNP